MMEAQSFLENDDQEVFEQGMEQLVASIPDTFSKDTIVINGRYIMSANGVP